MGNNNEYNQLADTMIQRISKIINSKIEEQTKISSAIVDSVNQNNTVNLYFPPESSTIFTNIKNQTPFTLQQGDSVEVLLKNGSFSNCWIIAKHENTYSSPTDYSETINGLKENQRAGDENINYIQEEIRSIMNILEEISTSINSINSSINSINSKYTALEKRVAALEGK